MLRFLELGLDSYQLMAFRWFGTAHLFLRLGPIHQPAGDLLLLFWVLQVSGYEVGVWP